RSDMSGCRRYWRGMTLSRLNAEQDASPHASLNGRVRGQIAGWGMGTFFAELKRRHIYRVAAAYAVVAWVLLQLVNNIAPGLNLPNSALTLVIVLLAVGFPIALVFAWIVDLKTPGAEANPARTTALDYVLAGALIAVIVLV